MANTVLTRGTEIYCYAPTAVGSSTKAVFKVEGAIEFNPGDETAEEIQTTELAERESHTFVTGLRDPGEASITIQVDPTNPNHKLMHDLRGKQLEFLVGWSDGASVPTVSGDALVMPSDRTWFKFAGAIKSFPFDFSANSVVKATMTIRRSGSGTWAPKTGAVGGGE